MYLSLGVYLGKGKMMIAELHLAAGA